MVGWGRFVNRFRRVVGGRFVHWLWFVIDRLWFVIDRLWFVIDRLRFVIYRLWFVVNWSRFVIDRLWRMVGFLLRIMRSSFISDLSHITIVMIGSVLDMLNSSIRKLDRIGTTDYISIRCLSSSKVGLAVIISYSILIAIGFWWVFLFFMVDRFWLVIDRFWRMVGGWFWSIDRFWWVIWSRFLCI